MEYNTTTSRARIVPRSVFYDTDDWWNAMFICIVKHVPETVDCKYCLLYRRCRCTARNGCPYLAERIEAGTVKYVTVVKDMFRNPTTVLRWKQVNLIEDFLDTTRENEDHEKRFFRIWTEIETRRKRDTRQSFAVLHLLTSNEDIYQRAYTLSALKALTRVMFV